MRDRIGRNIQKIRELKNVKQDYVAEKLGISQTAYSNIESGKTNINTERLEQISSILGVSPSTVENFNESIVFESCTQSGVDNVYNINSVEEIKALFQMILAEKDKRIELLEKMLNEKNK